MNLVVLDPNPEEVISGAASSAVVTAIAPEAPAAPDVQRDNNKYQHIFNFDALINVSPLCRSLLQLLQLDDKGIAAYLKDNLPRCEDAELRQWMRVCNDEDVAGRRYAIIAQAVQQNILYNYCDVIYVLNPYVVNADAALKPIRFGKRIASNFQVGVEVVAAPAVAAVAAVVASTASAVVADDDAKATSAEPIFVPGTAVKQGDPVEVVKKRLLELNPKVFNAPPKLRINAESCLLLDLLSMTEADRNRYILQCAIERELVRINADTQQIEVHPHLRMQIWPNFQLLCGGEIIPNEVVAASTTNIKAKTTNCKTADETKTAVVGAKEVVSNVSVKKVTVTVTSKRATTISSDEGVLPVATGKARKAKLKKVKLEIATNPPPPPLARKDLKRDDMADATKCMQRLMIEYKNAKPDADAASTKSNNSSVSSQHKRGARSTKKAQLLKQQEPPTADSKNSSGAMYRNTLLSQLQQMLRTVEGDNVLQQLGQVSNPEDYQQFLRTFDRTVNAIQKRLHTVPVPASAVPILTKAMPAKQADSPARATNTFSDHLNHLLEYVTGTFKYRMRPMKESALTEASDLFAEQYNLALIDKMVGKLLNAKLGVLVEGEIRINAFNHTQAYVTSVDTAADTIVETIALRQYAMHGDVVRIIVFKHTERTQDRANPSGFVVRILERRNDRVVLGHATPNKNKNFCLLQSTNKRVPAVRLERRTVEQKELINDRMLYMVRINGWLPDGVPFGEIVRTIGDRSVLATNNEAILLYNKLTVPQFSQSIIDSLPTDDFEIPPAELALRLDLRNECIFTIDPETARDLDDALSVQRLPNGHYEVGVHISDVTYYIVENSELDRQIREQATSIYLVDNVYHMLPRSLCMTCSLLPGQDKLAFSVFWEMNDNGDVLSTRYARTVIQSCAQLSYEQAQRMLDEPERNWTDAELAVRISGAFTLAQLAERVNLLHRLARPLREQRFQRYCLRIDQPKITFKLDDETGEPVSYSRYRQIDANWLIEEFMLLANQSVARTIHESFPDRSMLRNHSPPKAQGVETLAEKLRSFNFHLDPATPHSISTTMFELLNNGDLPENVMAVLTEWMMRPMNRATYVCSGPNVDRAHFALAIPIYTHFTSPIRRYPDVLVHRLLAAALRLTTTPTLATPELERIAQRCNEQKYNAKCAGEASTELYFAHYVRNQPNGSLQMRAVVTEMVSNDVFELMLLETGSKLRIVVGVSYISVFRVQRIPV